MGCSNELTMDTPSTTTIDIEESEKLIEKEVHEIISKSTSDFRANSDFFEIKGNIFPSEYEERDLITIEVIINKPVETMNNLGATFALNDNILTYLHTPRPYNSNIWGDKPTITPEIKKESDNLGLTIGKAFEIIPDDHPYKYKEFNKEVFLDVLSDIRVKITWENDDKEVYTEYIKLDFETIEIDEGILDFYTN